MYDTLNLNITLAKQRQEQLLKAARSSRDGQLTDSRRSPVLMALGRGLTSLGKRLAPHETGETKSYELQTNQA
ncbi:MAG: hypothetical protein IPM16_04625 [Chloroflexi bacterium]|nr:hypothetical protein [Chloroflexota bacterium]